MFFSHMSKFGCLVSRSMLNCVNALEQRLPASERAALMVAEEKPLPDSCKHPFPGNAKPSRVYALGSPRVSVGTDIPALETAQPVSWADYFRERAPTYFRARIIVISLNLHPFVFKALPMSVPTDSRDVQSWPCTGITLISFSFWELNQLHRNTLTHTTISSRI